ncbi:MAG: hypothetical protein M0R49_13320 [Limnochordia bacterium]|jgi:hypothetical protein|nr:hypothetical protein [Limnochordia bacterium]
MKEVLLGGLLGKKIAQALFEYNELGLEKIKEINNETNSVNEIHQVKGKIE